MFSHFLDFNGQKPIINKDKFGSGELNCKMLDLGLLKISLWGCF